MKIYIVLAGYDGDLVGAFTTEDLAERCVMDEISQAPSDAPSARKEHYSIEETDLRDESGASA